MDAVEGEVLFVSRWMLIEASAVSCSPGQRNGGQCGSKNTTCEELAGRSCQHRLMGLPATRTSSQRDPPLCGRQRVILCWCAGRAD